MDYVVGSVAALISGNVTPNRPRLIRRALTPTKHQQSPNVTPKSEAVDDRSIFLSPTLQKKKAIVKKSPKRIFQNPDLDATNDDNNSSLVSPKAEKVKKHLKDELEADDMAKKSPVSNKSPKNKRDRTSESEVAEVKSKADLALNFQVENESTPKKKKKKRESESSAAINEMNETQNNKTSEDHADPVNTTKSPKKMKQRRKSTFEDPQSMETDNPINTELTESIESDVKTKSTKKNKKHKQVAADTQETIDNNKNKEEQVTPSKKKNRKRKKKSKAQNQPEVTNDQETDKENESGVNVEGKKKKRKKKKPKAQNTVPMDTEETQESKEQIDKNKKLKKPVVNPNAITNKESDSEHESDDEIESENEEINKKVLDTGPAESSSDEEEEEQVKPKEPEKKEEKSNENDAEVLRRTLFVGNVPFSNKCKKEIKKIFNKYGQIETIRIRTVPVKDARTTPKLAVIKKELHPERSTVNVYIKYADTDSVDKALAENNTVLNEHHLRVSRSDSTGAEHDPKCSVFVGNLPFALEDEALRAKFEKCGEIDSVRIIRDKKTNAGKGFGYVNFKSKDGVELALVLTEEDLTIKNRILRVKRCTHTAQKRKHQPNQKREFKKFGREQRDKPGQGHKEDGAFRRISNKRKNQDGGGDGPPNKRQNLDQPSKEKKPRKEFVGMTAEKKKKRKFDKGQKKKKALSEILTK